MCPSYWESRSKQKLSNKASGKAGFVLEDEDGIPLAELVRRNQQDMVLFVKVQPGPEMPQMMKMLANETEEPSENNAVK